MSTHSHKAEADPERAPDDPSTAIETYLRGAVRAEKTIRIKSRAIAADLGLDSRQVGMRLADWLDDPPEGLDVDTWGDTSTGHETLWVISR